MLLGTRVLGYWGTGVLGYRRVRLPICEQVRAAAERDVRQHEARAEVSGRLATHRTARPDNRMDRPVVVEHHVQG